jgi:spectinomycin phosphotransferase
MSGDLHLCHTDLHAGNLLMGNDGSLHLIDWDGLSLAPRERDLMFIGGAVGGRWGRENPLGFEEGYGSDRGDPRWIAWYRHWRILQDLIEFQQVLLGSDGEDRSPQLRRQSLHFLSEQFAPGNVFDAAERVSRAVDRHAWMASRCPRCAMRRAWLGSTGAWSAGLAAAEAAALAARRDSTASRWAM